VDESVLDAIGAGEIPTILVPNKIDAVSDGLAAAARANPGKFQSVCPISALTGAGIDQLLSAIAAAFDRGREAFRASFSPEQARLLWLLRERGRIVEESYDGHNTHVTAWVTPKLAGQMRKMLNGGAGAP